MLISLLEEYDWSLLHFSTQVLTVLNKCVSVRRVICSDSDESSRAALTSSGVTYITENKRKTVGVIKLQSLMEWFLRMQ